jgi:small subunit ribosomal protein S9
MRGYETTTSQKLAQLLVSPSTGAAVAISRQNPFITMALVASLRLLRQTSISPSLSHAIRETNSVIVSNTERVRTFSSNQSKGSPARLRRPFRLQSPQQQKDNNGMQGNGSGSNNNKFRKHAVTLFPGDFTDGGAEDPFEDEDDIFDNQDPDDFDEADLMVQDLERREAVDKDNRERWIRNSVPPVRVSMVDERGRSYGRGGRKTASARVWIQPGFGEVVVNRKDFVEYFDRETDRELVLAPLVATETCGAFDLQIMVQGGGLTGQAGAVRHGLANALNAYNPDQYRPLLKALGLLERDARKVERKKIGHVKARKSPQWVRR